MAALAKVREFGGETVDELKKVTWPDWAQLKNATLVTIVFVLIVGAIIWGIDLVVRLVLDLILNLFAG
jgi:preprotein translocase subunit SecE